MGVESVRVYAEMFQTNASSCLFSVLLRLVPMCEEVCVWGDCVWAGEGSVCGECECVC